MATFAYVIQKNILQILQETANFIYNDDFEWDFCEVHADNSTTHISRIDQVRPMRFGIYDRNFHCYPTGEVQKANNGRWELIFNTYGFVSQSTYRVIEISDTQSNVIFTGAWNALCASNLMPQGIPHPYHSRIACEVSDITGLNLPIPALVHNKEFVVKHMPLSDYLFHRFLNYNCLAQPKFPIWDRISDNFTVMADQRMAAYKAATFQSLVEGDKFLSDNKQKIDTLEAMITSAYKKWPNWVRYEERTQEQVSAWGEIDRLALSIAGQTDQCDQYRSRAKTLVQALTAKIFKL